MYTERRPHVQLRCIRGNAKVADENYVSRELYDKVKSDCEKWYRLWLEECKKRNF